MRLQTICGLSKKGDDMERGAGRFDWCEEINLIVSKLE